MLEVKVAVGVGYEFAILSSNLIKDIKLNSTETLVSVDGEVYPLYNGETYEDSRKIDEILDGSTHPKIYNT
jgi:hypothetical protein